MTNFFFFKKATQSVCVCEWNSWKPKIQTQGVEFTEEGKGTNLGVFIRITSFSYSFKDEGQSISTILVFQITRETQKNLKTRAKNQSLGPRYSLTETTTYSKNKAKQFSSPRNTAIYLCLSFFLFGLLLDIYKAKKFKTQRLVLNSLPLRTHKYKGSWN